MNDNKLPIKLAPRSPNDHNKMNRTLFGIVVLPLRVGAVSTIKMVNGHTIETLSVVSIREISEQTISYETSDALYTVMRPHPVEPDMAG